MYEYVSFDGIPIRVGKNAKENDTMPRDPKNWWMHTADTPGAHVVIVSQLDTLPKETKTDAAVLAVYHSKAPPKKKTSIHLVRAEQVVPQKHAGQVILGGTVMHLTIFMNKEVNRLERLVKERR